MKKTIQALYETAKREFRFSLRELFALTFCIACGAFIAKADKTLAGFMDLESEELNFSWWAGLFTFILMAIACGLTAQAMHFWRELRQSSIKEVDKRCGVWLAIGWRFALAGLILLCFVLKVLESKDVLNFEVGEDRIVAETIAFPEYLEFAAICVAFGSAISKKTRSTKKRLSNVWNLIAWLILPLFVIRHLVFYSQVPYYTYLAISGMEMAEPGACHRIGSYSDQGGLVLFRLAVVAGIALLLALKCYGTLYKVKRKSCQIAAFSLLGLACVFLAVYLLCYYLVLFPVQAPDFVGLGFAWSWSDTLGFVLLTLGLIFWMAIQNSGKETTLLQEGEFDSNAETSTKFFHQSRLLALLVFFFFVVSTYDAYKELAEMLEGFASLFSSGPLTSGGPVASTVPSGFSLFLQYWLQDATFYITFAISILSVHLIFHRRSSALTSIRMIKPIPPKRMLVSTLFACLIVGLAIPALHAISFSQWLGPRGNWLLSWPRY